MTNKLKVLDLFAGIGGFALGLDSTGFFETVKFVEKDKYCQKVLQKNFPNIPIEEDIKNVKGKEGDADVIVGGFPCQPMSVAGKRKGTDDDRYLWPEMFRLIREIKPQFVIGENVQGIINIQNGMVLRQVQDDLESEGFEVQCFLIPASGIGAWHQRYRVWIVGHSQHNGLLAAEKRCRDEKDHGGSQKGQNETIEPTRTSGSRNDEDVSNAKRQRLEGHVEYSSTIDRKNERTQSGSTDSSRSAKDVSDTNTRLSIGENEEIQTRRETIDSGSSRGGEENVSDTNNTRGRASKHGIEREGQKANEGWKGQSQSESSRHDENVSNTEIIRTRESRNIDQEKGNQSSSSTQSNSSSKNVSNTNSGLRGGGRTIEQSGENKVWRFYSEEEEQARVNIWSETIGRNVVLGEKQNVTHSNSERQQEQCRPESVQEKGNKSERRSWWQIESELCGVPNGISYGLDKGRVNRIKTLGNAIVPQIARELGLAIKKVMNEDTNI